MGARLTFFAALAILAGCGARGGYELLGEGGRDATPDTTASSSSGSSMGGSPSSVTTGGSGGEGGDGGIGGEGGIGQGASGGVGGTAGAGGQGGEGGQGAGPVCFGLSASPNNVVNQPVSNNNDANTRVAISMGPNWRHGIAWRETDLVKARLFEFGNPVGPEIVLATNNLFSRAPDIVQLQDGGAVVAWTGNNKVFARRIAPTGNTSGPEVLVTPGNEFAFAPAAIAAGGDDSLAIAYVAQNPVGIRVRRYDSSGSSLGVLTPTANNEQIYGGPDVAMDALGNLVVAWRAGFGMTDTVFAQRYSAAGVAMGPRITVSSGATASRTPPSVDMTLDGRFVVSWVDINSNVRALVYTADGQAVTGPLQLNTTGAAAVQFEPQTNQNAPGQRLAVADDGSFLVSWTRQTSQLRAWRRFSAAGQPIAPQQQAGAASWAPAVAVEPCGGRSSIGWVANGTVSRAVFGP